jgi:hypothetical protein
MVPSILTFLQEMVWSSSANNTTFSYSFKKVVSNSAGTRTVPKKELGRNITENVIE